MYAINSETENMLEKGLTRNDLNKCLKLLKDPTTEIRAFKKIKHFVENFDLTDDQYYSLKRNIKENLNYIRIKWFDSTKAKDIVSSKKQIDPLELIPAFAEKSFASYFCALFFNGLINQVPKTFHISLERKTRGKRSVNSYAQLDKYKVRDTFMKTPIQTQNIAAYERRKYIFIEREFTEMLGVIDIRASAMKKEISIKVTDLERTLLDCIISPHRAGGIDTVFDSFKSAKNKLDIGKLYYYYTKLNFLYPYWQRIGFILQRTIGHELSAKWEELMNQKKYEFYLMHEYKINWLLDKKWKIFYPKMLDLK